mgnify:CR=1 FL=1
MYGTDEVVSPSFPYLVRHYRELSGFETLSGARLNITGREMPEVNTLDSPQFLPFLSGGSGPRGGEVTIDWYMQYMSKADYPEYPPSVPDFDDGWLVILNGTARFDMDAAMAFLGLPSDEWSDFEAWWTSNAAKTEDDYIEWLVAEGNGDGLDIFTMYDYPMTVLQLNLDAVKAGDEIVLSYDCLSWGMEALMTRWMRESFMPTEWWLRPVSSAWRVGEQSAVVWKRLYLSPPAASFSATGVAPHQGGKLIAPGSPYYNILRRWIANGATSLEAFPEELLAYRYLLAPTLDHTALDASYLSDQLRERLRDLSVAHEFLRT